MSLTEQLRGVRPLTDHERVIRILGDAERGPPTRMRQYHLIEEIGRGGFGVVYRANDRRLRRDVAIKKFALPSQTQRAAWGREALALAKLSHPNVVQIYEVIDDSTVGQSIVMEYVAGEQLDRWQQRRARTTRELLQKYLQAARGLHAAHRLGLVHRDFKPMNAIVAEDERVRVLDFGLAKAADDLDRPEVEPHEDQGRSSPDLTDGGSDQRVARTRGPERERPVVCGTSLPSTWGTQTRGFVGTIGYAAPEQVRGQRVGPRSDQFSFCASLYEALTGSRPYAGRDHESYSTALLEGRIVTDPGHWRISRRLKRALIRGLSIDPEQRHESLGSLIEIIEAELRPIAARVALVVLGILALSAIVVASQDDLPTRCRKAREAEAEHWVARTERVLASRNASEAGDSAHELLHRALDNYARRWLDEYQSFCQDEDQDALACLEVQQEGAVAGMGVAAESSEGGSTSAMNDPTLRALALQDPKLCRSRVDVILRGSSSNVRAKEAMAWVRESRVHQARGNYEAGMVEVERAVEAARQLGDDALIAAGLHQRGKLRRLLRVADASYEDLRAALVAASRSSSELLRPEIMADLAVHATTFEHDQGDPGLWLALARAEVESLGVADTELEAWVRYSSGHWSFGRGEYESAESEYRASRRIFAVNVGLDDLRTMFLDSAIAFAMAGQGRVEDAITQAEDAIGRQLRLQPEGHPGFVRNLQNLGKLYTALGEPEIALDVYDYSLSTLGDLAGDEDYLGTATERLAMLFSLGAESQALDGLHWLGAQVSPGLLDQPTSIPIRYWDVVLNAAHRSHAWSDAITAAEMYGRLVQRSEPLDERELAKARIVEADAYRELGRHCRVDEILEENSSLLQEQSPDNYQELRDLIDKEERTRPCPQ
ncbi:MAG: serine/threonine-protein kinase [Myxococcota bacterium]